MFSSDLYRFCSYRTVRSRVCFILRKKKKERTFSAVVTALKRVKHYSLYRTELSVYLRSQPTERAVPYSDSCRTALYMSAAVRPRVLYLSRYLIKRDTLNNVPALI